MVMGIVDNYSHGPIEENKNLKILDNRNTNNFKPLLCNPISQQKFKTALTTPHATDMLIQHLNKFKELVCESTDLSAIAINFQLSYKLRVEKCSVVISGLMF